MHTLQIHLRTALSIASLVSLSAVIAGCGASAGPDGSPEQTSSTKEAVGYNHFGGFGGVHWGQAKCPDYVTGIHGYSGWGPNGDLVNELGFACADGEHELGTHGRASPANGYFQFDCYAGDRAVGVHGHAGTYLDAVGLWCYSAANNSYYTAPRVAGGQNDQSGGEGGSYYSFVCDGPTHTLYGLDIWSGVNIDGFEAVCGPL